MEYQEIKLCRRCGRRLKTDEAKERGYGKICWKKSRTSAEKKPLFSLEERKNQLRSVTSHLPNVTVDAYDGLLAEYARERGCCTIVKGLRAGSDFEKEFQMAMVNRKLNPDLDSLFLTAEHQYMYLSSSAVKEMGYYGADLTDFLPPQIMDEFEQRMKNIANMKEAHP